MMVRQMGWCRCPPFQKGAMCCSLAKGAQLGRNAASAICQLWLSRQFHSYVSPVPPSHMSDKWCYHDAGAG